MLLTTQPGLDWGWSQLQILARPSTHPQECGARRDLSDSVPRALPILLRLVRLSSRLRPAHTPAETYTPSSPLEQEGMIREETEKEER